MTKRPSFDTSTLCAVGNIGPTLSKTALLFGVVALAFTSACTDDAAMRDGETMAADSVELVAEVTGFSGPEAVRYDPSQDVYFVSSFNGPGNEADNNGFISRVSPDGEIDSLRFIEGGQNNVTLHAPRGMVLSGDTLWVADHQAVRAFDRTNGDPLRDVDFSSHETGFLNDVTVGPDGAVYVTDTGTDRVFRISGTRIDVVVEDSVLNMPNGITWDEGGSRFIIVPYGGTHSLVSWDPESDSLHSFGRNEGAKFDGVEIHGSGSLLVASQEDSSLHLVDEDAGRPLIKFEGRPADIGFDTSRNRVAVPYVDLNLVEIWQLNR